MNIVDQVRLKMLYPELKGITITEENMKLMLQQKSFRKNYKKSIKDFIVSIKEYPFYYDEKERCKNINYQLSQILKLSDLRAINRYKKFIGAYNLNMENIEVLNDANFEEIFKLIGSHIFDKNICDIIKKGYSERFLELSKIKKDSIFLQRLNVNCFENKVWNIIRFNPKIGEKKLLDVFTEIPTLLAEIIQKDLFNGMQYTYENIKESRHFLDIDVNMHKRDAFSIEQFSMEFIHAIGDDALEKLYKRGIFCNQKEFKKLFQITEKGNYALICDIANYDAYNMSFSWIQEKDIQKELIELNRYDKREILLNKYFGIERNAVRYIKLFLDSINQAELPSDFLDTYGELLYLLNQTFSASDERILKIKETLRVEKKEKYKQLITSFEQEGNEILKEKFVYDLKEKEQEIKKSAYLIKAEDKKGTYKYDIYELSGQPFTMLVHAITNNSGTIHNHFVEQIIQDPKNWEQISNGNKFLSTSLISEQYMATYGQPNDEQTVLYGFANLSPDALKYTSISDAGMNRQASEDANINMRDNLFIPLVNTISTIDLLMKKTIETNQNNTSQWNEIVLLRKDIKPDYIVCMDHIYEPSIKAATYFHVPIFLIQRSRYQNSPAKSENASACESIETNHRVR